MVCGCYIHVLCLLLLSIEMISNELAWLPCLTQMHVFLCWHYQHWHRHRTL